MNNENIDVFSIENTKSPLYRHVAKTYGWMFLGLLITFFTSLTFYYSGVVFLVFSVPMINLILLIAQLVLVIALSARLQKVRPSTAKALFLLYSFVTGITLTPLFIMYELDSALFVFGITALFFGVMAAAGLITKKDLSKFGPLVLVGLIIMIVLTIINIFIQASAFDMMVSYIGMLIFLGVTAYDSNKIRAYYYTYENHPEILEKVSIISALNLYLDFINLFIYILKLLGKRK